MLIVGRYTCPSFSLIYSHLPHFSSAAHDSKIVWRNLVWLDDLRLQSGFDLSRDEQNGRKDELQFSNEYRDALRPRKLEGGWPVFGANTSRAKETKEMASSNQHLQFLYIYSQTEQESCKQAQDATHVGLRVIVCAFSERTNPTMLKREDTVYGSSEPRICGWPKAPNTAPYNGAQPYSRRYIHFESTIHIPINLCHFKYHSHLKLVAYSSNETSMFESM